MRPTTAPLLGLLLVAGCGLVSGQPDWVINRLPLDSCGTEEFGMGEGADPEARTCLLEAFEEGRGAELVTVETTVEGDPIQRYIRVHDNGTVEIFHDATRDRYGSGGWERLRCERLVSVADFNEQSEDQYPEYLIFVEDGCESLPLP